MSTPTRTIGRIFLGASLVFAGVSHLTVAREEFRLAAAKLPIQTTFFVGRLGA